MGRVVRPAILAALAVFVPLAHAQAPVAPPPVGAFVAPVGQPRCEGTRGYATTRGGARHFLWRPAWLTAEKAAIAGDPKRAETLRLAADAALRRGPYSVRDKTSVAASGDPGDYVSTGPYWWPDPNKPDGLPYIRRDGEENPERDGDKFDSTRQSRMSGDVVLLALAAHHLEEPRYAEHAARLVRTWFIDPKTRMNPNLNYAQAVPGRSAGRQFGVIDAINLIGVVEAIGVLEEMGAVDADDDAALRRWFGDLAMWMTTSDNGKGASATINNHGLYYDLMLAHFSLFSGEGSTTRRLIETYPARRLLPQIDASGRMPHELARTRPWWYSAFALEAALQMATLGECVGLDLWKWRSPEGVGLRAAVDYLAGYRQKLDSWPYPDKDLAAVRTRLKAESDADRMFRRAAWGWHDPALSSVSGPDPQDYLLPDYRP